jgi:hypothetical protein
MALIPNTIRGSRRNSGYFTPHCSKGTPRASASRESPLLFLVDQHSAYALDVIEEKPESIPASLTFQIEVCSGVSFSGAKLKPLCTNT